MRAAVVRRARFERPTAWSTDHDHNDERTLALPGAEVIGQMYHDAKSFRSASRRVPVRPRPFLTRRCVAGYNSGVDPEALREFAGRDWQRTETSKVDYWSTRFRQEPLSTWYAAQGLLAYVRQLRPSFPSDEARDEDFHDHLAFRSRLDRAAHAFARR